MIEPKNRTLNLKKVKAGKDKYSIAPTDFEEAKVMNTEPSDYYSDMISIRKSNLDLESDRQKLRADLKSGSKFDPESNKMFSQFETTINPNGMQT